ncbi:unnamed protein product [Dovyalis caffra]|uniref:Pectinesterase inhibitor domain-containing protein n=1 Tax=Dovyalis caffra TaxID=77055 RepID=A0AAV1QX03_9ROSI|nr:unnamed protein product [Dovyalis caffra]
MKNFMSISFMFLSITTFLLSISQCAVVPSDANLIQQICKRTPNFDLCVTSLASDPQSSTADVNGLALIMVDVLKAKATSTLNLINQQLTKSPALKQPLTSCASNYNAILTADIPEGIEALQKGDPKFAETGANDAAVEADICEAGFKGKSPLTNSNKLVHDTSAVTAAIVRNLL